MPEKKPDRYYLEIPRKAHRITFYTDKDSISFDSHYGGVYEFIILLNGKDSCFTQVIAGFRHNISVHRSHPVALNAPDTIPFTLGSNNKIHIKGMVNNSDTLNFQFDLGSSETVVTSTALKKIKFSFKPDGQPESNNRLQISNLIWNSIPFGVYDHNMKPGEDGLLGNGLFQDKVLEINYDKKVMVIHDSLPTLNPSYTKQEMLLSGGVLPLIEGTLLLKDKTTCKVWFVFDTGDSGNGFVTDEIAVPNKLYDQMNGLIWAGKRDLVVFPGLKIGTHTFTNVSGILERSGANTNDLSVLGNALLKRFNVMVDNRNGYVYLQPNSLLNEPFDHPEILIKRIIIIVAILIILLITFFVYRKVRKRKIRRKKKK